jgi:hypothetical protein
MPKLCEFETCRKQASYGNSYGKPVRCKEHKEEFKLVSKLCQEDNCNKFSSFNYCGEIKKYSSLHKKPNMIEISGKKCIYEGCNVSPSFNFKNDNKPLYCNLHKLDDMINIKNKKCVYEGCEKNPNYNYENEETPLYCVNHKLDKMIDVKHKYCAYINCKIRPSYNYEKETTPLYCVSHKLTDMIDILNIKCSYINCKIRPSYNYENEKTPLYCVKHKLDNMIDILNKNKRCNYEDCITNPSFNYENEKTPLYCVKHKLDNMIDILNKNKKCKGNLCLGTRGNPKYKGYCSYCYQHLFPNDPLTLQIHSKTKEIAVRDFINLNFDGFQHDKPLWSGNCDCTHRRKIDHRKLFGNTLLCIETDENQHKCYNKDDEEIRYDDLYMLHGGKFIFIRFNPDKFKDKTGKSVNPMLYSRLPILKQEIKKQIKRIENEENKELLEIIKLYYDEIKN